MNPVMERLQFKLEKKASGPSWMDKVSATVKDDTEVEKEAGIKDLLQRGSAALGRYSKYAKWGGLGLGAYLLYKALEGVHEAKQESAVRNYV